MSLIVWTVVIVVIIILAGITIIAIAGKALDDPDLPGNS